ncbi:MAG: hypothetical protein M1600_16820 [Firmicutes bacterium]|nr:hypothetical protein [Bacillota bacterium]
MDPALRERLRERYDPLIRQGLEDHPETLPASGHRWRPEAQKDAKLTGTT